MKRNEIYLFLKKIITGDKKVAVQNNINRKRTWSIEDEPARMTSKVDNRKKKKKKHIMLSLCCDIKES